MLWSIRSFRWKHLTWAWLSVEKPSASLLIMSPCIRNNMYSADVTFLCINSFLECHLYMFWGIFYDFTLVNVYSVTIVKKGRSHSIRNRFSSCEVTYWIELMISWSGLLMARSSAAPSFSFPIVTTVSPFLHRLWPLL